MRFSVRGQMTKRRGIGLALAFGLAISGALIALPSHAANTVQFAARYTTNANGAIVTLGNTLMTCRTTVINCVAAQNGGAYDNNYFYMANLDADFDPSTFSSSASSLNLPTGASVLWAGLYWGARLQAGTGGAAGTGNRQHIVFKTPTDSGYQTVASSAEFGPNSTSYNAYQEFADVTSLVQSAGNGYYWAGNVVAGTGADRYAGWSMSVVYQAPGLPLRNLTVFDGFDAVSSGNPRSITVAGFKAPLNGTVDAELGMVAYEGDASQTGDYTRLDNTQLATAVSSGSNFFNSTNDYFGTSAASRIPAYPNMLGYDIKNLSASKVIPNGATSATFTFSSNGDMYYPGVLTTAINLYAPDFTASQKTAIDTNGNNPAQPGDTIQYVVNYVNYGQDPSANSISTDPLPPGVTYVPGSLALQQRVTDLGPLATSIALTDGPGDDVGEYDSASRSVIVRLGNGATASAGGTIPVNGQTTYLLKATVDPAAGGTNVMNTAHLSYETATTGVAATYDTPVTIPVTRLADVGITKTMSPNPVLAGGPITAVLTVTNAGPNIAANVVVTDTLPAGMTATAMTSSTASSCPTPPNTPGAKLTCAIGDMANGAIATVTITGTTSAAAAADQLVNMSSVATDSVDPVLTNNVASAITSLGQSSDIAVTKTVDQSTAAPGSVVTYTVTVANNGPSDAQNLSISDLVPTPSQMTLLGLTPSAADVDCPTTGNGTVFQCAMTTLAKGQSRSLTITARLAPDLAVGVIVNNVASAASATPDPDPSNNRGAVTVTTTAPQADIALTKTAQSSAVAGGPIAYTLTATNLGPSDASDVVVTDTVPLGVTITSASTSRGTCVVGTPGAGTPQTVTCSAGQVVPGPAGPPPMAGGRIQIQLTGTVNSDTPAGTATNTASVTATTPDPVPSNNTDSASTTVGTESDVAVTKIADTTTIPDNAVASDVVYTVTVSNLGPSTAHNVTLSDQLPAVLSYVSAVPATGSCTPPPTPPPGQVYQVLTCSLGDLTVGATVTVTITMHAAAGAQNGGAWTEADLTEIATVDATDDSNSANNTAQWVLSGTPAADLQLDKALSTPATGTLVAGGTAGYTLTVTNYGPEPAANPVVQDTLPAGLTFVSSGSGCTAIAQVVTCPVGRVLDDPTPAPGTVYDSAQLTFTVAVDPTLASGVTLVNTATVSSVTPDPSLGNNSSTIVNPVATQADVAITAMTVTNPNTSPGAYNGPGSSRDQTFTIANLGTSVARDVMFRANLAVPSGVTAWPTGAISSSCRVTNTELICYIDNSATTHAGTAGLGQSDLWPGDSLTLTIPSELASYVVPGTYLDTDDPSGGCGEVTTTTPDSNMANNTRHATLIIDAAKTELAMTKTALTTLTNTDSHDAFVAGSTFAFQLTLAVPPGWADAHGVQLADPMPSGFTATSVSTAAGTCSVGDGTAVTCSIPALYGVSDLSQAPVVTITISGTIDPSNFSDATPTEDTYTNTATATSTTPGSSGSPASATASVTVDIIEQSDLSQYKTADTGPFYAGGLASWTITSVNAGPSDAQIVAVNDTLPVGLTFDNAASDPNCTSVTHNSTQTDPYNGSFLTYDEVICVVGPIDAGADVSVRIAASIPPNGRPGSYQTSYIGSVTNQATVISPSDPNPGNNISTPPAVVPVQLLADLQVDGGVNTANPAAGSDVTYTVAVGNAGPSAAEDPIGVATFPPGFQLVNYSYPPYITCSDSTAGSPAQVTITCGTVPGVTPLGTISLPGIYSTISTTLHIPDDYAPGLYTTHASGQTVTTESDYTNNAVDMPVTVQLVADTEITKTLQTNPIQAGRPVSYSLSVTNHGPSLAPDVTISDVVPAGLRYTGATVASAPSSACSTNLTRDNTTSVTCRVGDLDPGDSTEIIVTFASDKTIAGTLSNTGLVGSGALDPDISNNESTVSDPIVVPPPTDVGVTLTPANQSRQPGDPVALTAAVTNNGPAQATNVVLTLELPDGLEGMAGHVTQPPGAAGAIGVGSPIPTGATGPCVLTGTKLTCQIGTLEVGDVAYFAITGTLSTSATGDSILKVTATVDHSELDTNLSNDTARAEVLIQLESIPSNPNLAATGLTPAASAAVLGAGLLMLLGLAFVGTSIRRGAQFQKSTPD